MKVFEEKVTSFVEEEAKEGKRMLKSTEDSLSIKDTAPFPETKFLNVFEVAENITVVSILTADPSRI